ncbi:hypothetical protein [Corynebacterium diphtheriae]|uniref:Phage tail fiber protein n=2 Tax=Corynebacterium diphtheriae TaxID=1717 RepID=Q6NK21_CORDI|nr:hypothetical protein [Corynebacterium diphtheriae]OWN40499.1 hypothetical protein AY488_07245 [Corynebacterium belfantii]ARB88558.1 hypothetical protein A6J36_09735 [Corynebacterium diphtheriae]KKA82079.1 hypothetical protein VN94_01465 [Corynebacterium diphtheriae]OWM35544.1 hypothetical protein AY602_01885 [Corynebacterium diphtheriae bv. mitis]OWM46357.1 hypothetical protein BU160_04760 [Corynebacterium diphtheriae]
MPKLKGSLKNITDKPSTIREVLLRATHTRTNGKTITTSEPVRVKVSESGDFTETLAPGAAVLVLVGADFMARESIPLLVAEGMTTIAEAMEAARDFTPDVHDRLAELAAETQKNLEEARGVKAEADSATARMREAAQALKDSVDGSIAEATVGIKKSGSELLASMQALQSKAASSESEAKESAQGAEASRSAALASASSASSSAGEAAESLAGLRAKIEEWKPHGEQLAQWQPQFEWLKENAASGFTKIAELMQDAAAGVRGELSGLVEQAKTAQTTAGQHSLKAQAAAKDAESVANRVVDAAIAKLKGNAPAMLDTLEELAERVISGGTLETEILQKLSKMADSDTVKKIVARLDGLTIAGVQGLSAALADKAAARHKHGTSDINGLDTELAGFKGALAEKAPRQHGHTLQEISGLSGAILNVRNELSQKASQQYVNSVETEAKRQYGRIKDISVVNSLPASPDAGTIYLVKER